MYGFANEQSDAFIEEVGTWADAEGIKVKFSSTPDFDKLVRSRVQGNNLPDIAIFPQPGITLDIARSGKLADLRDVLDMDALESSVVPGILDAATDEEGAIFAAPMSISVKSLVWYPKAPFEAAGYEIPESHDELLALTEQIKADGTAPWCVGIESGPATGWPATDWLEDYVLRVGGTEGYDKWVKHEIPFDDPIVKEALGHVEEIWAPEGNVLGGRDAISSTAFATSGEPDVREPAGLLPAPAGQLPRRAGKLPRRSDRRPRQRRRCVPAASDRRRRGQGDHGRWRRRRAVQPGRRGLHQGAGVHHRPRFRGRGRAGRLHLPPHRLRPQLSSRTRRCGPISEIAYGAADFRFDGSDLMPGEVGAGSFWREMVEWTNGKSADEALAAIEASWPAG